MASLQGHIGTALCGRRWRQIQDVLGEFETYLSTLAHSAPPSTAAMETRGEVVIYAIVARPMLAPWDAWLVRHQYAYARLDAGAGEVPPFEEVRDHGYFQATFRVWDDEDWEAYWEDPQCHTDYQVYRVTIVDARGWDYYFAVAPLLAENPHMAQTNGQFYAPSEMLNLTPVSVRRHPQENGGGNHDEPEEGDYLFMPHTDRARTGS